MGAGVGDGPGGVGVGLIVGGGGGKVAVAVGVAVGVGLGDAGGVGDGSPDGPGDDRGPEETVMSPLNKPDEEASCAAAQSGNWKLLGALKLTRSLAPPPLSVRKKVEYSTCVPETCVIVAPTTAVDPKIDRQSIVPVYDVGPVEKVIDTAPPTDPPGERSAARSKDWV